MRESLEVEYEEGRIKYYLSKGVEQFRSFARPLILTVSLLLLAGCQGYLIDTPTPTQVPPQKHRASQLAQPLTPASPSTLTPIPTPTPYSIKPILPTAIPTPTSTPILAPTPTPRKVRKDVSIENLYATPAGGFSIAVNFDVVNNSFYDVAKKVPFIFSVNGRKENLICEDYPEKNIQEIPSRRLVLVSCIYPNHLNETVLKISASTLYPDDDMTNNQKETSSRINYGIRIDSAKGKIKNISYPRDFQGFPDTSLYEIIYDLSAVITNTGAVPVKNSSANFLSERIGTSICEPNTPESIEGLNPGKSATITCNTMPVRRAGEHSPGLDEAFNITVTGLPSGEKEIITQGSFTVREVMPILSVEVVKPALFRPLYPIFPVQTTLSYQSFRLYESVELTRVYLPLVVEGNPQSPPIVSIMNDNNGYPDRTIQYKDGKGEISAVANATRVGNKYYANFAGVPIDANKDYWIGVGCICTSANYYGWSFSVQSDGKARDIYDRGFGRAENLHGLPNNGDFGFSLYGLKK